MNKITLFISYPRIHVLSAPLLNQIRLKSDDSQKEDKGPKNVPEKKSTNKEALDKLNLLLNKIIEEDVVSSTSKLELAKPRPKRGVDKQKKESKDDVVNKQTGEKDVLKSVKKLAESLGGDTKQTESELLAKLLNTVVTKTDAKVPPTNLSDIVKGMKIDRTTKSPESLSRAQQVKSILQATKQTTDIDPNQAKFTRRRPREQIPFDTRERQRVNLFGEKPLGIFSDVSSYTDTATNKTWQKLYERDLKLAVTNPPANYFQQMILWTEQGKLWRFPIDNEQDMEEEQNVYFADHVFLEKHLEPWCPPKGPIRHFMELVCVGLSKNPYMTVQRKQEHLAWYKDYFLDKQKLLTEVGAIPADFKQKKDVDIEN